MAWNAPFAYRVILEPDDNDTVLVSFPDFPEAHTFGDTAADALEHARDALATIIGAYIRARRPLPPPSAGKGPTVSVPILTAAKMALHQYMVLAGVTKTVLARRLKVHPPQVDRLLDIRHRSRLDQLERALEASDLEMHVTITPRAKVLPMRPPASRTSRTSAPRARHRARPAAK